LGDNRVTQRDSLL